MRLVYIVCKFCKGTGELLGRKCKVCKGEGQIPAKVDEAEKEQPDQEEENDKR